jgi:hypothetical protein
MHDRAHDLPNPDQLQREMKREMRWYMLRSFYMGRPIGVNERLLVHAMTLMKFEISQGGVRNELEYLAGLGLITVTQGNTWHGEITPAGVDCVEYNADCPKGIARPEQE